MGLCQYEPGLTLGQHSSSSPPILPEIYDFDPQTVLPCVFSSIPYPAALLSRPPPPAAPSTGCVGKRLCGLRDLLHSQVLEQRRAQGSSEQTPEEAARGGHASPPPNSSQQAQVAREPALENDMFLLLCLQWLFSTVRMSPLDPRPHPGPPLRPTSGRHGGSPSRVRSAVSGSDVTHTWVN